MLADFGEGESASCRWHICVAGARRFSNVMALLADFRERKRKRPLSASPARRFSTVTAMLADFGKRKALPANRTSTGTAMLADSASASGSGRWHVCVAGETLFDRYGHVGGLWRARAAADICVSPASRFSTVMATSANFGKRERKRPLTCLRHWPVTDTFDRYGRGVRLWQARAQAAADMSSSPARRYSTVTAVLTDFGERKRELRLTCLCLQHMLFDRYGHDGGLQRAQAAADMSASSTSAGMSASLAKRF
jgi:hypothetical protein